MNFLKCCLAATALLLLQACTGKIGKKTEQEAPPAATTPAPAVQAQTPKTLPQFAVVDAAGKTLDIQSFKGKKVLVNLWATWCPPCRAEMPSLEKLYGAINKERVQFVMLSLDKDFELAKNYVQTNRLDLPIYYPAADLPELFSVNGIPTTFIFNEQGELIEQREGSDNYDTEAYRKLFGAVN
jgi:thiol-disulfide isomerase/thioredoxin